MSFGTFISSKILGSHLTMTNKSDKDQIFEVAVDKQTKQYGQSTKELLCDYIESELPFQVSRSPALNAESVHNCLFIENPKSKNLEKSLMFKLAAKASFSLVVVLKAPKIKKLDFLSYVTVRQVVS